MGGKKEKSHSKPTISFLLRVPKQEMRGGGGMRKKGGRESSFIQGYTFRLLLVLFVIVLQKLDLRELMQHYPF